MSHINITWLGHACFKVEHGGYAIVLDPYTGVKGYDDFQTTANAVLCSHGHGDHSHTQAVVLENRGVPSPFTVTQIACFHDDAGGSLRGDNIIHVLEAGGLRIAHMGDLGHMLSTEQIKALGRLDAVMVPVGGHYTIDAATALRIKEALSPRVFIPMHFRRGVLGFDVLGHISDFLDGVDDVVEYGGNSIEIEADTPVQTAVLQYLRP